MWVEGVEWRLEITDGDGDSDGVGLMLTNKLSTSATPRLDWDIHDTGGHSSALWLGFNLIDDDDDDN